MKQITRKETWEAFFDCWCPKCLKHVEMAIVHTGLPGIQAQRCPLCGSHYQINLLESGDDLLNIEDELFMPGEKKPSLMNYLHYLWDYYCSGLPEGTTYVEWCYNNGFVRKPTSK